MVILIKGSEIRVIFFDFFQKKYKYFKIFTMYLCEEENLTRRTNKKIRTDFHYS